MGRKGQKRAEMGRISFEWQIAVSFIMHEQVSVGTISRMSMNNKVSARTKQGKITELVQGDFILVKFT